jgi:hypothetical protein
VAFTNRKNAKALQDGPVVAGPAHGDSAELFMIAEIWFAHSRNAEQNYFDSIFHKLDEAIGAKVIRVCK